MGDMTEPEPSGIPTWSIQGTIIPPCPTCGALIGNIHHEGFVEDRRLGRRDTTMRQSRVAGTLVPCGHLIREYTIEGGNVTRLVAL